jgi:hypothetical protein
MKYTLHLLLLSLLLLLLTGSMKIFVLSTNLVNVSPGGDVPFCRWQLLYVLVLRILTINSELIFMQHVQ